MPGLVPHGNSLTSDAPLLVKRARKLTASERVVRVDHHIGGLIVLVLAGLTWLEVLRNGSQNRQIEEHVNGRRRLHHARSRSGVGIHPAVSCP